MKSPIPETGDAASSETTAFKEIEVKLTGEAAELSTIFKQLKGDSPSTSRVVSTYYDTPDGHLWQRGFSLRLREKGDGHELTLKRQDGKAWERGEWTSAVRQPVADIGLLPEAAPRRDIGAVLPEELNPLFASDIKRAKKNLALDGAMVEVALDLGRIVNGAREAPVAELEFELLNGSVAVMLEHVRSLMGPHQLAFDARSKAARGIDFVTGAPPDWVKAVKPTLGTSDTIDRAVTKIVGVTAMQITGNLAAAADGRDPEGVHQLRVALRRLRSAFTLFKRDLAHRADGLGSEARRALGRLGPARDLDVFLLETMPPVLASAPDNAALLKLVGTAEARREDAYADVRQLVREPEFNRFLLDLMIVAEYGGLVVTNYDMPLRPAAVALLQKRHKNVLKVGGDFANLPYPDRHRVRIALKKLRYACDYFQDLFDRDAARPYLKRMASLQDDLGRLNDATVAEQIVDSLAGDDKEARVGGALVTGWYRHRLMTVEPHMLKAWTQFAEARPFWRA